MIRFQDSFVSKMNTVVREFGNVSKLVRGDVPVELKIRTKNNNN